MKQRWINSYAYLNTGQNVRFPRSDNKFSQQINPNNNHAININQSIRKRQIPRPNTNTLPPRPPQPRDDFQRGRTLGERAFGRHFTTIYPKPPVPDDGFSPLFVHLHGVMALPLTQGKKIRVEVERLYQLLIRG